ncbi:MAG: hypothetical protein ACRD5H_09470, partial [Nitrososphaerales archaeon]
MTQLTPYEIDRRKLLVEKLKSRILTPAEGEELRQLLEKEKQEASQAGNFLVVLGLLFLLGLLISYLGENNNT